LDPELGVLRVTVLNRSVPDAPTTLSLTAMEIGVLDRLVNDKPKARQKTLSHYVIKIARLSGYLPRASDPPSVNTVRRGLSHRHRVRRLGRRRICGQLKASPDAYVIA